MDSQPAFTCLKLTIERQRCEINLMLTIETPERHYWRRFGVFIIIFEDISHLFLVFLLLTLNMQLPVGLILMAESKVVFANKKQ